MELHHFKPHPRLQHLIEGYTFMQLSGYAPPMRCMHNNLVKLILTPDVDPIAIQDNATGCEIGSANNTVEAFSYRDSRYTLKSPAKLFAVCCNFFPAGFYDVFNVPVSLLYQHIIDVGSIVGQATLRRLLDSLASACTWAQRVQVLNAFFLSRWSDEVDWKRKVIYHAQRAFISSHGQLKVDEVLKTSIICRRTLERLFSEYIGLSPKYYARTLRFVEAYRLQTKADAAHWSEIVYRCGYHDLSHYIREFQHFTGETPHRYFSRPNPMADAFVHRLARAN